HCVCVAILGQRTQQAVRLVQIAQTFVLGVAVCHAKIHCAAVVALIVCLLVPLHRGLHVLFERLTLFVSNAQQDHSACIASLGCTAIIFDGLGHVLFGAHAGLVGHAQEQHTTRAALLCCL